MSGLDEAVIKNVEACKQLSKITRTSLGPNGAPQIQRPEQRWFFPPSVTCQSTFRISDQIHDLTLRTIRRTPSRAAPGMNKMVINHLDKLFVTSDAAVIVRELEVAHPAAKLLVWRQAGSTRSAAAPTSS